jgi:hypothetical protein
MISALILMRCPTCRQKLALNGTMLTGTLVVCVTCGSHLQVDMAAPRHLTMVNPRLSHTADSQPESYG